MPSSYQYLKMLVHSMQCESTRSISLMTYFTTLTCPEHICHLFFYTCRTYNSTFVVHPSHWMTHTFVELIFILFLGSTHPLFDLIELYFSIDDQVILVILKIIALTCHQMCHHSIYFLICSLFLTLTLWFNVHA